MTDNATYAASADNCSAKAAMTGRLGGVSLLASAFAYATVSFTQTSQPYDLLAFGAGALGGGLALLYGALSYRDLASHFIARANAYAEAYPCDPS